jgi:hypothetical protein
LPEELEGKELSPLCLASKIDEAKEIESVLDRAGMDFTFEITPFTQKGVIGILFGGVKEGVMFLVPSGKYETCKTIVVSAGLSHLIIE